VAKTEDGGGLSIEGLLVGKETAPSSPSISVDTAVPLTSLAHFYEL